MPPDRGAVKKSPYDKKQAASSTQKKSIKDDVRISQRKNESNKEKEIGDTRDKSSSQTSKGKTLKEEVKSRTSVREKLAALKNEAEKAKVIAKDVKSERSRTRESQSSSRVAKDVNKNTKPVSTSRNQGRTPASVDVAPRRSQLSYRSTYTLDKPKMTTSSKTSVRKNTDSSASSHASKSDNARQLSTRKDIKSEKLPNKIKHPERVEQSRERSRQTVKIDEPKRLGRDRTRTRTLSPREVKVTKSDPGVEKQKSENLKQEKEDISKSIAPVASTSHSIIQGSGDSSNQPEQEDASYDYEDDFEDYESDFEDSDDTDTNDEGTDLRNDDISSDSETDSESELMELTPRQQPVVEEEKKLDSGNYDLAERRRKGREIEEIKMALNRENEALSSRERIKSHLIEPPVPADEGYEEGKSDDSKKFSNTATHLNFINFANARKRKQEKKANENARKRGEELLDMIRLDVVNYTLFEMAPIPYEVYMKSYGRSNTLQAYVQTNEDNLSEEIQTDEIQYKNKWTQKPVSFRTKADVQNPNTNVDEVMLFSQDHLGVGGDSVEDDPDSWKERLKIDTVRLNQFLLSAGQVISVLLEEGEMSSANKLNRNLMEIPFSDGYISLGIDGNPFLSGRPITSIRFPLHHSNLLLTVHKNIEFEDRQSDDISLCRCMIAIWNILEPSFPQKILVATHDVTACCFDSTTANLVFAGHDDGSVCVWDLREKLHCHRKVETENGEWILRSPTYNTAEIFKDKAHLSQIVALQPFVVSEVESETIEKTEVPPTQICSLDEGGTVVIWTVIQSYKQSHQYGIHGDLGLAYWGRVYLVCSSTFSITNIFLDQHLQCNLQCFDLQLDSHDNNHLYIGTNMGYVAHSLKSGGKPRPQLYIPNWDGFTVVKSIEVCPYGKPYFLIGCGEGTIRLHFQASEKPLVTLAGTGDPLGEGSPIISLQWSRSKPLIFFALDSSSKIHVWDLSISDIYPQYTVPFGTLTAMQLSPDLNDVRNPPHLALATGPGRVEVHQLRHEYINIAPEEVEKEMHKFVQYTSIL